MFLLSKFELYLKSAQMKLVCILVTPSESKISLYTTVIGLDFDFRTKALVFNLRERGGGVVMFSLKYFP